MTTLVKIILWTPATLAIVYSAGWVTINIISIVILIYLAKYLWNNNPFRDKVSSQPFFKYVVLEHKTMPDRGLRFWSTNSGNNNPDWYKEILFTNDDREAIRESQKHGELPTYRELEDYYNSKIV